MGQGGGFRLLFDVSIKSRVLLFTKSSLHVCEMGKEIEARLRTSCEYL